MLQGVGKVRQGGERLFAPSQNRGHHTRAEAAVHYGNYPQGLFVRHVGNQVFTYSGEPQRPGR
jgi:hypothetical protein